jgi:hypothetical protein
VPIREKAELTTKILIKQHSKGIDRRYGRVQQGVILIRKIIGIQNTEALSRKRFLQ